MNIHHEQLLRPEGLVMRAYYEVAEIVEKWAVDERDRSSNPHAEVAIAGWSMLALCGPLAVLLLRSRGYDPDLLEMALDAEPPGGWTLADLDAELERTRSLPPARPGNGEGEG